MQLNFPDKLNLAQLPTLLQPLERISAQLKGPRIWVKRDDLTEFGAGGNKIRKLEFVLAQALAEQADCVITCGGVQSNHCRATALLAAKLGLKCHLILRGDKPTQLQANTMVDNLAGASISFHPLSEYNQLDLLFASYTSAFRSQGMRPYCIPTGASDEVGLWGYIKAAEELNNTLLERGLKNAGVCCATGSGGTHAGLSLGLHLLQSSAESEVRAYAVCDDATYFINKAHQDISAWYERYQAVPGLPKPLIQVCDDYIGPGYAKVYPELLETIRWVAQTEGMLLDPVYTGKAFHGMVEQIKQGQYAHLEHLVFIHTGGVFGLFPYQQEFGLTS